MDLVKIGKFLQALRKEKGLTQEQLAEMTGVARRTVSRWETGSNMADLDILIELSDFYKVDLREILNGERSSENMNEEVQEAMRQVAEYGNEEKNVKRKRLNRDFIIGGLCIVLILLREDRDPKDGELLIPELQAEPLHGKKDSILRGTAMILLPAGLLFGICIVLNGHLSAGGGFSGGAVIGAALILFAMAYGPEKLEKTLNRKTWSWLVWSALLVYTLLKTYSFYTGANGIESIIPLGEPGRILSGGMILPLNICVGVVVACTMYAFYALFSKGGIGSGGK